MLTKAIASLRGGLALKSLSEIESGLTSLAKASWENRNYEQWWSVGTVCGEILAAKILEQHERERVLDRISYILVIPPPVEAFASPRFVSSILHMICCWVNFNVEASHSLFLKSLSILLVLSQNSNAMHAIYGNKEKINPPLFAVLGLLCRNIRKDVQFSSQEDTLDILARFSILFISKNDNRDLKALVHAAPKAISQELIDKKTCAEVIRNLRTFVMKINETEENPNVRTFLLHSVEVDEMVGEGREGEEDEGKAILSGSSLQDKQQHLSKIGGPGFW